MFINSNVVILFILRYLIEHIKKIMFTVAKVYNYHEIFLKCWKISSVILKVA